jgi:hypothetical protein
VYDICGPCEHWGVRALTAEAEAVMWCAERSPPIEEVIQAGVVPQFVTFLTRNDMPQLQVDSRRLEALPCAHTPTHLSREVHDPSTSACHVGGVDDLWSWKSVMGPTMS